MNNILKDNNNDNNNNDYTKDDINEMNLFSDPELNGSSEKVIAKKELPNNIIETKDNPEKLFLSDSNPEKESDIDLKEYSNKVNNILE